MPRRLIAVSSLAVTALLFSGCASYNRIADYPAPRKPVEVAIVAKPMSKMNELPVGTYYDEPRQIIISGHQKGLGWGMMFGLVGVLVADSANRSSAETRFGESAHGSGVDLGTLTREVVEEAIKTQKAPGWSLRAAPAPVQLSPYAVFTVLKSGQARLYAMLRAEIPGADGKPSWSVRYFARAPGEFTIEGAGGWMAGTRFTEGMRTALARVVKVCIDDTQGQLTIMRSVKARGVFPYMNTDKFELPFLVAQENDTEIVARLAAGDVMVMAGTHVLNRADYAVSEATIKDPRK